MNKTTFLIDDPADQGIRIDKFISEKLKLFSRSQLKYHKFKVCIGEKEVKLSRKLCLGDNLIIEYDEKEIINIASEQINLDIIYEDDNVIVLNKPQGLIVHPGSGNKTGTLVNGLMFYLKNLKKDFNDDLRPGIVHRLDKDTSGAIIAAKNMRSYEYLASQFRRKKIQKIYYAIVKNNPPNIDGEIETNICRDPQNRKRFISTDKDKDGKKAITKYSVLKSFKNHAFVKLMPVTGRTHQLRVHMLSIGCPIVGDPIYSRSSGSFKEYNLMLHAYKLIIRLPGNEESTTFRSPLPERFKKILIKLSRENK